MTGASSTISVRAPTMSNARLAIMYSRDRLPSVGTISAPCSRRRFASEMGREDDLRIRGRRWTGSATGGATATATHDSITSNPASQESPSNDCVSRSCESASAVAMMSSRFDVVSCASQLRLILKQTARPWRPRLAGPKGRCHKVLPNNTLCLRNRPQSRTSIGFHRRP